MYITHDTIGFRIGFSHPQGSGCKHSSDLMEVGYLMEDGQKLV